MTFDPMTSDVRAEMDAFHAARREAQTKTVASPGPDGESDRRETHAAMLDLIEQGKASSPAYRALAARLMRLNGE